MIALSDIKTAYLNATPCERIRFLKVLAKDNDVIKMHFFDLMSPVQFEMLKRMIA